ncbi:MAG: choice-of-anchor D domain-containing protein, partial [Calditrichaeota bacterium]|nr:choice-of-anchor D domain-containing protein [Calditrichota bacterium]
QISNDGFMDLVIENIEVNNRVYSTDFENRIDLEQNEMVIIQISFEPDDEADYEAVLTITSNDDGNENGRVVIALRGTGIEEEDPGIHFLFDQTDMNSAVMVNSATIDGELLEGRDEVGIFTPGGICAGGRSLNDVDNEFPFGILAWGDDLQTEVIEGFRRGEEMIFLIWDADNELELEAIIDDVEMGEPVWQPNSLVILSLITEENGDPEIVVNPVEIDFGEILVGDVEVRELSISNTGLDDLVVENLETNDRVFSTNFEDEIILARNEVAVFEITFEPEDIGEYEASITISSNHGGEGGNEFEVGLRGAGIEEQDQEPHFLYRETIRDGAIIINSAILNGEMLSGFDEIGVFTPGGVCAGGLAINDVDNEFPIGLLAWGDDPQTEEVEGFVEREELNFRFWDSDNEVEVLAQIDQLLVGNGVWFPNGFTVVTLVAEFEPDPVIEVVPGEVIFGEVLLGDAGVQELIIMNHGIDDLIVEGIEINDGSFGTDFEDEFALGRNEFRIIEVSFEPEDVGVQAAILTIISNNGGQDGNEFEVELSGTGIENQEPGHHFRFVATADNHAIIITSATLNGEDLEAQDEIAAFTPGGICAGAILGEDMGLTAWGDDAQTEIVEGFQNGEQLNFRYWDFDIEIEIIAEIDEIAAGQDIWQRDGFTILSLVAEFDPNPIIVVNPEEIDFGEVFIGEVEVREFQIMNIGIEDLLVESIEINNGMFSTNFEDEFVLARDEIWMAEVMFEPEEEAQFEAVLTIISNNGGREGNEFEIELSGVGIEEQEPGPHFEFNLTESTHNIIIRSATLHGEMLENDDEIGVFTPAGLCAGAVSIEEIMNNEGFPVGLTAWGDNPRTEEVEGFVEGELLNFLYWDFDSEIEVEAEIDELRFGEQFWQNDGLSQLTLVAGFEQHFEFITTGDDAAVLINSATLNGEMLEINDEIGIFTPAGICAGAVVIGMDNIQRPFPAGLSVWGDDPDTEEVDGFQNDELMTFRYWDFDNEIEIEAEIDEIIAGGQIWRPDGFNVVTLVAEFEPHFEYIVSADSHSIIVTAAILNGDPLEEHDEIGVFTPDGICAGAIMIDPGNDIGIAVWGDDPRTEEIEGFQNGEQFNFRYWDFENEIEVEAQIDEIMLGQQVWAVNGFTIITLVAENEPELVEQVIELNDHWNMISLNIIPVEEFWEREEGPDVVLMLEQIIDQLNIAKDENGSFYVPEFGFCNIPFWSLQEAYQIKVEENVDLRWLGIPIPVDQEIQLAQGWNLLAYTPAYELDASSPVFYVLSPIIENVISAKNGRGEFMLPQFEFSNMPPWRPGQGYQVNASDDVEFVYPPEQEEELAFSEKFNPEHNLISPLESTGSNMSLLLNDISGNNVQPGDIVSVLSSHNTIVGQGSVDRNFRCGLAVWGDDEFTDRIDGMRDQETFSLVLSSNNDQYEIRLSEVLMGSGLKYRTDVSTVLNVTVQPLLPEGFYMSTAYPNPFNSTTKISYGLPNDAEVSIQIYDITGCLVEKLVSENQTAGHYSIPWNAGTNSTGLYLIRLETEQFSRVTKVILTK